MGILKVGTGGDQVGLSGKPFLNSQRLLLWIVKALGEGGECVREMKMPLGLRKPLESGGCPQCNSAFTRG